MDVVATIKMVAMEANVSVATVSRVLNNNGYVNEDTRQNVLQAIEKFNYKPNAVARSLFKKESKTIALIVPNIQNPFFPEIARAVEDLISSKDYTLILCNSDDHEWKERKYVDVMKQKYVDGIIIVTSTATPNYLENSGIPIVSLDRFINEDIPLVSVNNRAGARLAVSYLKSIGCNKIAHVQGPMEIYNARERYYGFLGEVEAEPWFCKTLIVDGDFNLEKTKEVTKQLLTTHPDIDGIFAGNDYMAIGVIKAAQEMGVKVPEDISVIGFDGIDLCHLTTPEITTIKQPIYQIGRVAAKLLFDLIEGKHVGEIHHELDVELDIRESTKKCRELG